MAGQVFACAAGVCRALLRPLAADPPRLLGATVRLRYSRSQYVRRLAAQAFGPVLRQAPPAGVRAGVRALLAGTPSACSALHVAQCQARVLAFQALACVRTGPASLVA